MDDNAKKTQNNLPKNIINKPKVISLVFFIIIVMVWVPHTLAFGTAGVQSIFAFLLAPLAIMGLFLSYSFGINLAKFNYEWIVKGKLYIPYLILFITHIVCIGECIVVELILAGYPFAMCFDICEYVEISTAIAVYSIVSSILFIPAYCSIYLYYKYILKYNLPNPKISIV